MFSPSEKLPDHSRVWVYQSNRALTNDEVSAIGEDTRSFLEGWTAHNQALQAGYEIRYNRFLILMADESAAGASGCSIDKSVHFIKSMEKKYGIDFFDRMLFTYRSGSGVEALTRTAFESHYAKGILNGDSIVFNNLVTTKGELRSNWEIPVKQSWHQSLLSH